MYITLCQKNSTIRIVFIVFDQNASIKENIIKSQTIDLAPSSELYKLCNARWFIYGGVTVLTVFSITAIAAFIKYIFDQNEQENKKIKDQYEGLLKENKQSYESKINDLEKRYNTELEKVNNNVNDKHKEIFDLQQRHVDLIAESLELKKLQYAEAVSEGKKIKDFIDSNKVYIEELINLIDKIAHSIKQNNEEQYYENFIESIKDQEKNSFDYKDILSFVLEQGGNIKELNESAIDKNKLINEHPNLNTVFNLLYQVFKVEYESRKNNPERHGLYKKNSKLIDDIISKYNNFLSNIRSDNITQEYNDMYLNIMEVFDNNNSISIELLFNNAYDVLSMKIENNMPDLQNIFPFLSKEDKKILKETETAFKKEKKLREKDITRQYQWWLNKDDNKDRIEKYKNEIVEICDKINSNKVGDYTTYEEFKKEDIQSLYQLLLFCDNYNFKINEQIENEQEIIAVLLSEQYNKFQYSMEQEEKRRKNNPNRNSIY